MNPPPSRAAWLPSFRIEPAADPPLKLGTRLWGVRFKVVRPLESFPQPILVRSERQSSPAYHHDGRFRPSEWHCMFKLTLAGEGRFKSGRKRYSLPAGYGFLCEISDPVTSYYFPPRGRRPWDFVYLAFTGPAAVP